MPPGAARFRFPGRLAQLGERQLDKLEVTGSSPVTPIPPRGERYQVSTFHGVSFRWAWWGVCVALLCGGNLAGPSGALAAGPEDVALPGGKIEALWASDTGSAASLQDIQVELDHCFGLQSEGLDCVWSAELVLDPTPPDCTPVDGNETVVWSSGPQEGDGSVSSGPLSFQWCRGRGATFRREYERPPEAGCEEVPFCVRRIATEIALLRPGTIEEAERAIIDASPAAAPAPPVPPPPASISRHCRTLTVGQARYLIAFRRLGCRKAAAIAKRFLRRGNPRGYRCRRRANGRARCWRIGKPRKFVSLRPARG